MNRYNGIVLFADLTSIERHGEWVKSNSEGGERNTGVIGGSGRGHGGEV